MHSKKYSLVVLFLFSINGFLMAQSQGNTPYSAFNYGEITDEASAAQEMMGGTGVSTANGFYINTINPALLVKNKIIGNAKYVSFNVGFKGNNRTITQSGVLQKDFGLNMSNITVAWPVKKWYAMGVTLRPYSIASSHSVFTNTIEGGTETIVNEYDASGGINRVSFTNSFLLFKKLYVGLDASYNYSSINKDSTLYIPSVSPNYYTNGTRYSGKGYSFKLGTAYQQKINEDWRFNLGATYELKSQITGEHINTFATYVNSSNGLILTAPHDTLSINDFTADLPEKLKVGISLEKPFNYLISADFSTTKWRSATLLDDAQRSVYANNATELNVGAEWLPNSTSTKYFNQVFYRAGFKIKEEPYVLLNQSIVDKSVSFGLSLPLGFRSPSYVDLGLSLGNRGFSSGNQINENYVKISANFSLMSAWFRESRVD